MPEEDAEQAASAEVTPALEGGTYEIIRQRLLSQSSDLKRSESIEGPTARVRTHRERSSVRTNETSSPPHERSTMLTARMREAAIAEVEQQKTKHKLQLESGQHPKKAKQGSHPDFSDDKR